ncbi:MAG: AAA family ATPase [Bacteroidales bacterium]|nr:AAA family ATPase [Bacteroidales bacterium]
MVQKIIGRRDEMKALDSYYRSGDAEFVAIYGRRRVGKTFLVRQYFGGNIDFDLTGVMEGNRSEQMEAFHQAMVQYGYKGKKAKTWMEAFFSLRQLLEPRIEAGKRCVIFIDELPCLDTPKSGFVKALGHFWNSWANWQSEIMLMVCGSATSWMVRNIIDNHGGLHDRITHEMHLHPFTLKETEEYFQSKGYYWNRLSIVQAYMAIGGVPYYMSLFNRGESPAIGLDRLFFGEKSELKKEYKRLFSSLFKNAQPYLNIVEVLAQNGAGLTRDEIAAKLDLSNNGKLGDWLTDLEYCDFISKNKVRNKKVKENSAVYQLIDFYTIFYHTFIHKASAQPDYWSQNSGSPKVNTWYGLAFERVCKAHVAQIKDALGIPKVATESYVWRSSTMKPAAQVDLIIDRRDDFINLCEIKYSKGQYELDQEEYQNIMRRVETFKSETNTHSSVIPTLISTFGMTPGLYSDQISVSLTLEDLFR